MHGRNFIGFELSSLGQDSFKGINPATGESLEGSFHEATKEELNLALDKATAAAKVLRRKTGAELASYLEACAEGLEAAADEIRVRAMAETALPEGRIKGETGRTVGQLRLFARVAREGHWAEARIDTAQPDRKPLPRPDLRRMLIPLGPVAVFGASNFPLAFSVAGGDTASALAAGNPVIVKAHPSHPGTSELVAEVMIAAAQRTRMPDGTFSLLHGGPELGRSLVLHPALAAVGFTGSYRAGRALFDAAAGRPTPIPVYAEMSSVNPTVILPHALRRDLEGMAQALAESIALGVGQFCTNPGLILLEEDELSENFVKSLRQKLTTIVPGVMLNAGINKAYRESISRLATHKNVEIESSPQPTAERTVLPALGRTSASEFLRAPDLAEEVFGPFSLVVTCSSRAELASVIQALPGQLTGTLYSDPEDRAEEIADLLEQKVGRLLFSGVPTGVEVCDSMQHGGPWPASSDIRSTSVGTAAIQRFARPICFQNAPDHMLPPALQRANPLRLWRTVDGKHQIDCD
jgi:NADP-dependent aldehyde dehydrogenase